MMRGLAIIFLLNGLLFGLSSSSGDDDHDGHQHSSEDLYDCQCTTGYTVESDIKCGEATKIISGLESYLVENKCDAYCANEAYTGSTEDEFKCFQAFTLVIQYHNYCEFGTVNETLIHEYLEKCPDCKEQHHQHEGAPDCDGSLKCTNTTDQVAKIMFVKNNCVTTCDDALCVPSWQTVEGYHRACSHHELSEEFDEIFDSLLSTTSVCDNIYCNVPWEQDYTANCTSEVNHEYEHEFEEYGKLDLEKDIGITDGAAHNNIFPIVFTQIIAILSAVFASYD